MGPLIGGGIASVLSLFVLSRAIADNPFYRFAQSLLIGTALGYAAAVLLRDALLPPVLAGISGTASPQQLVVLGIGLLLGLSLLPRFGRQRGSWWANIPLAVLFGVGAALALVGAIRGTLVPQLLDTIRLQTLSGDVATQAGAGVLAVLTISTLLTFTYTTSSRGQARETGRLGRGFRGLGRLLILMAFGVFFAATVTTYIAALVRQVGSVSAWFMSLLGM